MVLVGKRNGACTRNRRPYPAEQEKHQDIPFLVAVLPDEPKKKRGMDQPRLAFGFYAPGIGDGL